MAPWDLRRRRSALDPLIERSVEEVLNTASANVTTVLVAHKLKTVVDADLILVMSNGTLVEQGTHTSLLCQANSTYARMWAEQVGGFGDRLQDEGAEPDYCKLALSQSDPGRPAHEASEDAVWARTVKRPDGGEQPYDSGWLW